MSLVMAPRVSAANLKALPLKRKRVESIDLLRGTVMIIMAIDHVRDYFHRDAFLYSPTDLSQTSIFLFSTRWITHFCAPIFVLLAGVSAWLYGRKRTKSELSFFLLTRGIWLILLELFVISLFRTFNPTYTYTNLQVIWAIGISMIVLSAMVYLQRYIILLVAVVLLAGHNLLDGVHVAGDGIAAFGWSLLHESRFFTFGNYNVYVHYPLLPWIGLMCLGYYLGHFYDSSYDPAKRQKILFFTGSCMIILFILLRFGNVYGDAAYWSVQPSPAFSILSFLNVSKYPPSLLYVLVTIGPGLIFLSVTERPLKKWTEKIAVFGRVPMFYYLAHILLIHIFATFAAPISGHKVSDMIITTSLPRSPELKGYGFNLLVVYLVWAALILILYPLCKWFDRYKKDHLVAQPWLSYL